MRQFLLGIHSYSISGAATESKHYRNIAASEKVVYSMLSTFWSSLILFSFFEKLTNFACLSLGIQCKLPAFL